MNEGMPREALATHWASQREKGSRHREDVMFSESKGGTLWRSRKAGNGAGQLILKRGTRSRKGRRCRGLWAGLQLGCGCLSGTQMALLMVGDASGSLGWQLGTWGLLNGLCSRKGAGHYEDSTVAPLRSQWPSLDEGLVTSKLGSFPRVASGQRQEEGHAVLWRKSSFVRACLPVPPPQLPARTG